MAEHKKIWYVLAIFGVIGVLVALVLALMASDRHLEAERAEEVQRESAEQASLQEDYDLVRESMPAFETWTDDQIDASARGICRDYIDDYMTAYAATQAFIRDYAPDLNDASMFEVLAYFAEEHAC